MIEHPLGEWHLLGAGRIGTLAAHYLQQAGASVQIVGRDGPRRHRAELVFADGRPPAMVDCPVQPPGVCRGVRRLVVATKTPYTGAALARLTLAEDAEVVRLQNGIGSLDGTLGPGQRLIEGVTASAVMTPRAPGRLRVVAENATHFGGGTPPAWFEALASAWPRLAWAEDIRPPQWRKLVANAAINPLTALHDVPNGALLERRDLYTVFEALVDEADRLLSRLDTTWPGDSRASVEAVVRTTAGNTSSMRADVAAGARTEIDAINGWLLHRAREIGLELPTHADVVARVRGLEDGFDGGQRRGP